MNRYTVVLNDDLDEVHGFQTLGEARRFAQAQTEASCYEITRGAEYGVRIEFCDNTEHPLDIAERQHQEDLNAGIEDVHGGAA